MFGGEQFTSDPNGPGVYVNPADMTDLLVDRSPPERQIINNSMFNEAGVDNLVALFRDPGAMDEIFGESSDFSDAYNQQNSEVLKGEIGAWLEQQGIDPRTYISVIDDQGREGQSGQGYAGKMAPGGGGEGGFAGKFTPPRQEDFGWNTNPEAGQAMANLFNQMSGEQDPERLNALVQSVLGLSNLPQQDFFSRQFPGTVGDVQDVSDMAYNRALRSYDMPNAPDSGAAQFYSEGQPAQQLMQQLIQQSLGINSPQLSTAREAIVSGVEEDFAEEERNLESSLAARGMLGSTQADEARRRLREGKGRAMADAELQALERVGAQQRANIGLSAGTVGQSEGQDIMRREGEFGRSQTDYGNLMQNLMASENIAGTRLGQMQQPLSMLLSALSGVNVAPGTAGQLQMPAQRAPAPGLGELFGQMLPSMIGNLNVGPFGPR